MSDFSDVVPVDLNTEEPQLCQILYDEEYKSVMGVLLALLKKREYSERALELTQTGIDILASHYTIWNYRYNILLHLKKDLLKELDWCEELALENEKNYQIWNYRQLIIGEILRKGGEFNAYREYAILDAMLEQDSKNHHVWSYRKWLVEKFGLYRDEREVEFVNKCISADLRNNSAWTHRFFIKFGDESYKVPQEDIDEEIEYTQEMIKQSPQNPSSWNYLLGVYNKYYSGKLTALKEFCQEFTAKQADDSISSSFALEVLGRIYAENFNLKEAEKIYTLLKDKYDPIRKNYWDYQIRKINQLESRV